MRSLKIIFVLATLLFFSDLGKKQTTALAAGEVINTIAGNGIAGFSGDGGPAISASLSAPGNIAIDSLGRVLICDIFSHRVRRIESNGNITTVAGSGVCGGGPIPDGSLATSVNLCSPNAIALNAADDIFISDGNRILIFRIDSATGTISKVAGNGIQGYNGDGISATSAGFSPHNIALDSTGNIFIADDINNRIRRIDAVTGIITTVVGDGTPGYNGDGIPATSARLHRPLGVALDSANNIFIAEQLNHRVRRVDAVTGIITTLAGQGFPSNGGDGGLAINAFLNGPRDVTVDTSGNVFIADNGTDRVRRINAVTGIINTVAGNGTAGFSGDGGPAINAQLSGPRAIAIDLMGNLFIADFFNYRIRRVKAPNQSPIVLCQDVTVTAGSNCSANASINNGSYDPNGDAITVIQSPAGPYPLGTTNVTLTVTDSKGASSQCLATVTVTDGTLPTITPPPAVTVNAAVGSCGAANVLLGTPIVSDNCSVASTMSNAPAVFPLGNTTVIWTVTDGSGNTTTATQLVTVVNPNPVATITGPPSGSIFVVGTSVNFTGTFTDAGGGTHSASWLFDTINQTATVVEPVGSTAGSANTSYLFTTPGVYLVKLTLNDSCGGTITETSIGGFDAMVVIYDPNGGFVTGGGWITSPAGAYTPNPTLTGKANFGFVSRYKTGASIPSGQTEFQFKAANFNFQSSSYEWLVVAGARAQYKGTGSINGTGGYSFLLTVIDGQLNGGGGSDKFRIKIWDAGGVIYDNQIGAGDNDHPTTALGGGSIVVHK